MRSCHASTRLFALLIATLSCAAGCIGAEDLTTDDPLDPEEPIAEVEQTQLDPNSKTYTISQSAIITAKAWVSSGTIPVEYWAAKSGYSSGAARVITGASESCLSWKNTVCSSSWAGATYYQAIYSHSALNCSSPPGAVTPSTGAVSFLASGSYSTTASSVPYAWTYVSGNVEYWAMNHLIDTTTTSSQAPSSGYSGLTGFIGAMCAMSSPPTEWFTAYYVPVANFCSTNPC